MKIAVQYAPPFTFSAMRIGLGAVSLFLAMIWLRKPLAPREIKGTFWAGVLQIAGVYGLATWALVSGGAGKTSVLVYVMPIWTLIFAWIFLGERIRGMQWFAIGLSVAGMLLILDPFNLAGTPASKILAVLAGVSWAGGAVVAKRVRQTVDLDLLSFTSWQMVAGAMVMIPVALLKPATPVVWSAPFIFALIYNTDLQHHSGNGDRNLTVAINPQPFTGWHCWAWGFAQPGSWRYGCLVAVGGNTGHHRGRWNGLNCDGTDGKRYSCTLLNSKDGLTLS